MHGGQWVQGVDVAITTEPGISFQPNKVYRPIGGWGGEDGNGGDHDTGYQQVLGSDAGEEERPCSFCRKSLTQSHSLGGLTHLRGWHRWTVEKLATTASADWICHHYCILSAYIVYSRMYFVWGVGPRWRKMDNMEISSQISDVWNILQSGYLRTPILTVQPARKDCKETRSCPIANHLTHFIVCRVVH